MNTQERREFEAIDRRWKADAEHARSRIIRAWAVVTLASAAAWTGIIWWIAS